MHSLPDHKLGTQCTILKKKKRVSNTTHGFIQTTATSTSGTCVDLCCWPKEPDIKVDCLMTEVLLTRVTGWHARAGKGDLMTTPVYSRYSKGGRASKAEALKKA